MSKIKMYKDSFNNDDYVLVSHKSLISDFIASNGLSGYDEIGYDDINYFLDDFYYYLDNLRRSHEILSEDVEKSLYSEFEKQVSAINQTRNNGHVLLVNVKTGNFNIINKNNFGMLSVDDKVLFKGSYDKCAQFQYEYSYENCELSIVSGIPENIFVD